MLKSDVEMKRWREFERKIDKKKRFKRKNWHKYIQRLKHQNYNKPPYQYRYHQTQREKRIKSVQQEIEHFNSKKQVFQKWKKQYSKFFSPNFHFTNCLEIGCEEYQECHCQDCLHNAYCGYNCDDVFNALKDLFNSNSNVSDEINLSNFPSETHDRRNWVRLIGHFVPTKTIVDQLCKQLPGDSRCISVGAGCALLEYLVKERLTKYSDGSTMRATDVMYQSWAFLPVEVKAAQEIDWTIGYNVLFICWPLPGRSILPQNRYDYYSLTHFRGKYVIFVGFDPKYNTMRYRVGSSNFLTEINNPNKWNLQWQANLPNYTPRNYFPVIYLYQRL